MQPRVISYKGLPMELEDRLKQHFSLTSLDPFTERAAFISALRNADGMIGSGLTVDAALLQQAPSLRVISTISAGYDNFDIAALNHHRVLLMNTPDVLTETVADTMMALILSSARRIVNVAERMKKGEWTKSIDESWFGDDVHDKTLGIIGMGRIGMALARRANAGFNMPIQYYARRQNLDAEQRFAARRCDLNTLLATSDFVCLVLPLTEETYHFIGRTQLEKMKPSAFIINVGRGSLIDEPALVDALRQGTIAGAGLDVFEHEPLAMDSPLLTLPNVVAVPHIGSATHETRYKMMACAVDNLIAAFAGHLDKNCVNPQVKSL